MVSVPARLAPLAARLVGQEHAASGVYFLLKAGEVVYVGQSSRVRDRLSYHRCRRRRHFDSVLVLPMEPERLVLCEGAFIGLLRPSMNRRHGDPVRPNEPQAALLRELGFRGVKSRRPEWELRERRAAFAAFVARTLGRAS